MTYYGNPLVLQRADPWVLRVCDDYYFTASDPQYNHIALRKAKHLQDLQKATEVVIWRKHDMGAMSKYIWAPELHRIDGVWYIYVAAAQREFEPSGLPTHRMYVLRNTNDDPLCDQWEEMGQIDTGLDTFSLDATSAVIGGVQYLVWAQKDPNIEGNSNLYIAQMENPWTLATKPVMLSRPEYDWECVDYAVNEGPAFLFHDERVFITYSASGTGVPYAVGLLQARIDDDLLDPQSWSKSAEPVFATSSANGQFGPGHNSFTTSEDGKTDLVVYHARNYTRIEGDPLFDPNRHARVGEVKWVNSQPVFGEPTPDDYWTPTSRDMLPSDGGPLAQTPV